MIVSILVVLAYSVPESTIRLSKVAKVKSVSIFPEGWAFFTKDPKEEEFLLYRVTGNNEHFTKETNICGSAKYLFGIKRTARMQLHELGAFRNYISEKNWITISGTLEANMKKVDSLNEVTIVNPSKSPFYCGIFIVQGIKPLTWAWAKNSDLKNYRESKICKINVVCN